MKTTTTNGTEVTLAKEAGAVSMTVGGKTFQGCYWGKKKGMEGVFAGSVGFQPAASEVAAVKAFFASAAAAPVQPETAYALGSGRAGRFLTRQEMDQQDALKAKSAYNEDEM